MTVLCATIMCNVTGYYCKFWIGPRSAEYSGIADLVFTDTERSSGRNTSRESSLLDVYIYDLAAQGNRQTHKFAWNTDCIHLSKYCLKCLIIP